MTVRTASTTRASAPAAASRAQDLSIGAAAEWAGVATSTLRYWEELGLIDPARRRGGHRVYDESALDRLSLVLLAQRAGFTLAEVRQLLCGFPPRSSAGERWRSLVDRKQTEVRSKIEEL